MKKPTATDIRKFRSNVYTYYRKVGRDLPWRSNVTPYKIFISEVMLQQTQVDRVIPKFCAFIAELTGFSELAQAPLSKVFELWQGLGYNRRALALKNAAVTIVNEYGGVLPDNPETLRLLPGIGPATAASITAFAFNKPALFLETNIRTVLIHHFFKGRTGVTDNELIATAGAVLDRKDPFRWYSALMDYGSGLKKEIGNLSLHSVAYKKQSPFEGSRRQLRGNIIRSVLDSKRISLKKLCSRFDTAPDLVNSTVRALCSEGLLHLHRGIVSIGAGKDE
jgi:A/G-specific adenine glycosylase